jgi:hypothetical protein
LCASSSAGPVPLETFLFVVTGPVGESMQYPHQPGRGVPEFLGAALRYVVAPPDVPFGRLEQVPGPLPVQADGDRYLLQLVAADDGWEPPATSRESNFSCRNWRILLRYSFSLSLSTFPQLR